MALSLRDVRRDPVANRALEELMHHYTVAEEKSRLVLTKKAGNMMLFLNDLDDLHQLDFVHNQKMVKEIERLRVLLATIEQQRESWKVRALMAEAQLLEAIAKPSHNGRCQNVGDVRYASLKRFLAKQFHPDYAPGQGIEKIVRNEIFKEIWNEIERLDQGASAARFATARSASASLIGQFPLLRAALQYRPRLRGWGLPPAGRRNSAYFWRVGSTTSVSSAT